MFEGNPVVYSLIGTMQTGAVILANLLHLFFVYLNRVVQWRMPASSFSLTSSNLGQARKPLPRRCSCWLLGSVGRLRLDHEGTRRVSELGFRMIHWVYDFGLWV